jgi:hypothetical protein
MILRNLLSAALFCALAFSLPAAAQDSGYWRAASNNAFAITGDIHIAGSKVTINFSTFPLAPIRTLKPEEVSVLFDTDVSTTGSGSLYRLAVPASIRFVHKNTLCGSDDTQWMATYPSGHQLQVAFFSGLEMPAFTLDAITHSTSLCGTFTYTH